MAPKKEVSTDEAPSGIVADDSYKTGGNEPVPVVSDDAPVEDPIDDKTADTDAQLGKYHLHTSFHKPYTDEHRTERDDKEAIDKSNILDERTRHAKPTATYREPGDTEGLPENTGRSATSTTDQVLSATQ